MSEMRDLDWLEPGEPLAANEIASVEELLGVKFPSDYIMCIAEHSGASNPSESDFLYVDRGKRQVGCFGSLLSLRAGHSDRLVDAFRDLGDQLPVGIIPVVDACGDFVCLDYRKSNEPTIAYFAHELSGDDSIIAIASSFSEFLDSLYIPDEE